jgi:hypothetical protein
MATENTPLIITETPQSSPYCSCHTTFWDTTKLFLISSASYLNFLAVPLGASDISLAWLPEKDARKFLWPAIGFGFIGTANSLRTQYKFNWGKKAERFFIGSEIINDGATAGVFLLLIEAAFACYILGNAGCNQLTNPEMLSGPVGIFALHGILRFAKQNKAFQKFIRRQPKLKWAFKILLEIPLNTILNLSAIVSLVQIGENIYTKYFNPHFEPNNKYKMIRYSSSMSAGALTAIATAILLDKELFKTCSTLIKKALKKIGESLELIIYIIGTLTFLYAIFPDNLETMLARSFLEFIDADLMPLGLILTLLAAGSVRAFYGPPLQIEEVEEDEETEEEGKKKSEKNEITPSELSPTQEKSEEEKIEVREDPAPQIANIQESPRNSWGTGYAGTVFNLLKERLPSLCCTPKPVFETHSPGQ